MGRISNTNFFPVNRGYVIETEFDNDVEVVHIKQILERNKYNNLSQVMEINIPSVGLNDKFDDYTDSASRMVFQKAEMFIGIANGKRYNLAKVHTQKSFYRSDAAYANLMREIDRRRAKVK